MVSECAALLCFLPTQSVLPWLVGGPQRPTLQRGGQHINGSVECSVTGAVVELCKGKWGAGLVRSCPRPAWRSRRGFWEVTLLK